MIVRHTSIVALCIYALSLAPRASLAIVPQPHALHAPASPIPLHPPASLSGLIYIQQPNTELGSAPNLDPDLDLDLALPSSPLAPAPARPRKRAEYVEHNDKAVSCRPFGLCQPCPEDELDQPFCLPFGNRRLLHCSKSGETGKGEIPAWEACGRVVALERRRYWEFVTLNLLLLIVALAVLWARTSALATHQYRQLAARIGIR